MKGLLRKDLYLAWATCRIFLLMAGLFLVVGAFSGEESFFLIYPMIIGMILPVSLISYDERSKWNLACDAMPLSRATVVSEKYLLTLLSVLAVFLLTLLAQGLRLSGTGDLTPLRQLPALLLPLGLLGPALLLPVVFWLGVEKGRILYFVLVGLVCAVGVFFTSGTDVAAVTARELPGLVLVPVCAVVFALSWGLSIVLYRRREL